MEDYLRRVESRLGADTSEDSIHAVLGGPRPDVDTVAATLCLALHLSQKETPGQLCVPVLCGRRRGAALPEETVSYLQRVSVRESSLLWREDVDLLALHRTGKLSLTLLRDGLLNSSEYHALESSILRVVHQEGQQDTGDDGASFAVTTVAGEIRHQEAADHVRATLGKTLGEALQRQSKAFSTKHGRQSTQLEEHRRSLELWSSVTAGPPDEAKLQYLEQLLTLELKEYTDGEMTVAFSSMTTDEDWNVSVDGLKSFSGHHGLDGLVVLMSSRDTVGSPFQQVAVYSNNTEILNQICCELEESSSWSLSGELEARENLQVYHIPSNTSCSGSPLLEEEIQGLLRDFVDRRSSVLACHPSSRTSSTEGVAGSVEFSQGSSGINDMDGSDIDRAEDSADVVAIARVMADGEEDARAEGNVAVGELVSPDSGMTTIRSSRSSKESSVFLSDDSPVGEVTAGGVPGGQFLRNPSPLGLLSLSPPVPPVPPERRRHRSNRSRNDNFDLFSFDPLHSKDQSSAVEGELANPKVRDWGKTRAVSSNLSELEELSLLDFSDPNSLDRLESRSSSGDRCGQIDENEMTDTVVPPTPVNSLVGSRPPSSCGVTFFPEDVAERINGFQHKDSVSSSLSETWDELGFDTQGTFFSNDKVSNRTNEYESLQNIVEDVGGKDSIADMFERESMEEMFKSENAPQRPKRLEPQLSVVTEQTKSYENWNPDSAVNEQWNTVTLADLQLTPPEEVDAVKSKPGIYGARGKTASLSGKNPIPNTLTPDTSKEEDEGLQGKKDRQVELLDFWTYSAQKGFLKSDSGTTTSYPESLDLWNMTIRDDSISPLTTPDNLSENAGAVCGLYRHVSGGTSVESPQGFSVGGMEMWNTTIQEDSSSSVTSPEGPENGKDLSHMGSLDPNDSTATRGSKQSEAAMAIEVERGMSRGISQSPEEVDWRRNDHNVKIIIESAEGGTQVEFTGGGDMQTAQSQPPLMQNMTSEYSESDTSAYQSVKAWDLPVPGMVTSTSEYDNIGAGAWSLTSFPEPNVSPLDIEGQSSPFIALAKPAVSGSQVFLFEGTRESQHHMTRGRESSVESEYDNKSKEGLAEADGTEQPSDYSPFFMVDCPSETQQMSVHYHSSPGEAAETQSQNDQLLSYVNWDSSESASLSQTLSVTPTNKVDGSSTETQQEPNKEIHGNLEGKISEAMSLGSSCDGRRDPLKYSPDSLHSGSRDEVRSNSDGDSSSGLEMEYIVVSGTVKEAEREWHDRPRQRDKQTKGTRRMETFSMLSYAASVLQTQVQDAHRKQQESTEQTRQNQMSKGTDSAPSANTEQAALSSHYQVNQTQPHMVPDMISPSQSKNTVESFRRSNSRAKGFSQTQVDEGNYEDKSSIVTRGVSPSSRYPSDNFLRTREEVYVHSQISMEDSDEGGQSPPAPPPCPTSLGEFQDWGGQLVKEHSPPATSETQSPVLTNSSVSHHSSLTGTPLSESVISADRGLGLPFSGDLMEEENDKEEQEVEIEVDHVTQTKWNTNVQSEKEVQQHLGCADLLSFTEDLSGGSSIQQWDLQTCEDGFLQDAGDGQHFRTADHEKCSTDQPTGNQEASRDRYSLVFRHQDASSRPTDDSATYLGTGSHNVTQGQTQYGYNYHHIDQRTENQSTRSTCADTKSNGQQNPPDVYAEFTTDATAAHYGSEQGDSCGEAGLHAGFGSVETASEFPCIAESQYGGDSDTVCTSGPQCSPYQADSQRQCETSQAHFQFDGQPIDQSDVPPESEGHAESVPEGYAHFSLSSRHAQQKEGTAGMMMMKRASNEEAAEELDNREDPPSSADQSASSHQRRKLAAPPMNVSLDHSEGSLLSEDALDTEDEALGTGDDLDINIDELDTPDEADSLELNRQEESEESRLDAAAASRDVTAGRRSAEEGRESRLWGSVVIGEQEHRIDMKCIEPYKRVISHGGYYAEQNAIIVFAACFLPDSDCDNYNYVMENLFLYVISTLELMVAEDYMIVYLNGATPHRRMPGFSWMKRCYQMIDRRLKKNLKMFIIVHPSWFIRTLLGITRPFISSKFSSKIKYVNSLQELGEIIPMEYVHIPPSIVKADKRGN